MKSNFKELWLCDVCRRWFPTEQIRKVPHDALQVSGSNYIQYSEYSTLGTWYPKGGATYLGKLSMGCNGDFRLKVQEGTTGVPQLFDTSLMYAADTFVDNGSGVSGVAFEIYHLAYNSTLWDSICFSAEVGPKEDEAAELQVEVGMLNNGLDLSDPTVVPLGNFTIRGHQTVWFSVKLSDIAALMAATGDNPFPYIKVTAAPSSKYWIQNVSVTPNASVPGVFFPTNGSPAVIPSTIPFPAYVAPTTGPLFPSPPGGDVRHAAGADWTRMAVYACPKCADEVLLRRRTPGRRENRMIPPYEERET